MERQEKIDIIKKHITNVIAEEQPKYQVIPNFFIFDKKEFFEDTKLARLNRKYNLIRNNSILEQTIRQLGYFDLSKHYKYLTAGGFTNGKEITILLNNSRFNHNFNDQLYFTILTTFHEFRHIGQMEKFDIENYERTITSFDDFRFLLERNCHTYLPLSYSLEHDDFYFEIDANLYSIEKTDEFCTKNNISTIGDQQQKYKQRQYSKMLTYDFDKFIELNRVINLNPLLSNRFSKNPTYNLFFNNAGGFKKLSDIIKNPLFYSLDDKLKIEMLTSNSFLSSINYDLNDVEKNLLLVNVDSKINDLVTNYNKNREFYEQNIFDYITFIKNSSSLLSKMDYLLNFKLQHTNLSDNKDTSISEFKEQIQNIRAICDLKHDNSLTYSNKETMNNQLNTIISTFNDFFVDNNSLENTQKFSSTVKILYEAILAKIDISSMPVDAQYERMTDKKNISLQNNSNFNKVNNKEGIQKIIAEDKKNTFNNYSFTISPSNNAEAPQLDSAKVRRKTKGTISYDLIFFVNIFLSILITIGYLFIVYK